MRIIDFEALRRARLRIDECAACGGEANGLHHVVQKSSPHFGDDVYENLVGLCGSGTSGCHGAFHGSPYTVRVTPDPRSITQFAPFIERRDAAWVGRKIGRYLLTQRPDVIEYVRQKLGDDEGAEFLRRFYSLETVNP